MLGLKLVHVSKRGPSQCCIIDMYVYIQNWKMPTLSSLVAQEVVIMTTNGTACDEKNWYNNDNFWLSVYVYIYTLSHRGNKHNAHMYN